MTDPGYSVGAEHAPDELVVGGPVKTREVTLTDTNSQGALSRGMVLGYDGTDYAGVHQTGSHTGATARAILAKDADPSGGDVTALVYEGGDFNIEALSFGGTVVVADCIEELRENAIHLKASAAR